MKNLLGVRKPGQLKRVGRVLTGPEVGGSRPVCVTFPSFPARDEIWKRAGCLAGSSIYISEDVTRRAKDSRTELRRFMREVKSVDPGAEYRFCFYYNCHTYLPQKIYHLWCMVKITWRS